jgi:hypothetical protein
LCSIEIQSKLKHFNSNTIAGTEISVNGAAAELIKFSLNFSGLYQTILCFLWNLFVYTLFKEDFAAENRISESSAAAPSTEISVPA